MTSESDVKAGNLRIREKKYYDTENHDRTNKTLKVMAAKTIKAIKKIGDTEI